MPSADEKKIPEYVWVAASGPMRETEKAFLYETGAGEIWITRSQLGARKKGPEGKHIRIELPKWLAIEKGLFDPKDKK